jgi:hypothetical protein
MTTDRPDDEITALRARVAELEHELFVQQQRTNEVVARAQARVYWLDRWHLDLNELMARPGAAEARELVRRLRGVVRRLKQLTRGSTG